MDDTQRALISLSLAEAARRVKSGDVSPVELVDASLARIDAVNPKLAAYISVFADEARKVGKAAEIMASAGNDLGPLHGIPIALKDNVAVRGMRTTAGSKVLADWVPARDATVTARLRQAGRS